ncbi:MAG TPA: NAD-dependent epimerase/dehydratase family protein [Solirubrobacterales bacterium]|nr:NAD-dependent epimerase/dehydratase family protein [Solirubrobacterales bacterium]
MARRVVITGISSHWGAELARRLERDPEIDYIAGIDTRPPPAELERTDFIEADIRSPVIARLLPSTNADTVVHCGILWYPEPGRPPRVLHEINVIGTLQLLAACERTESLEAVIVRGSAAIYGSEGAGPYFYKEEFAGKGRLTTRFQRDISELEEYFVNFARRHPELVCTMLRYQPEIGPDLASPLVRYLTMPVVPIQLGFDPRLQLLHADDATAAIERAVHHPVRGAVNVGPDGSISLSRALRILRRPAVPIPAPLFEPALRRLADRLRAGGLQEDGVRLLRYGRGVDNRRLREDLGFEPAYDALGAVEDLARAASGRRIGPDLHPGTVAGKLTGVGR